MFQFKVSLLVLPLLMVASGQFLNINIKSDMPKTMEQWIASKFLERLSDGYDFNNISAVIVDDLNQRFGGQWFGVGRVLTGFPQSLISPNTTITIEVDDSTTSFYQLNQDRVSNKVIYMLTHLVIIM